MKPVIVVSLIALGLAMAIDAQHIHSCFILPGVDNGYWDQPDSGSIAGTVATLTCRAGYQLNGDSTIDCEDNGQWEQPTGRCDLIGRSVEVF